MPFRARRASERSERGVNPACYLMATARARHGHTAWQRRAARRLDPAVISNDLEFCCRTRMLTRSASCGTNAPDLQAYPVNSNFLERVGGVTQEAGATQCE
jgi:hypothetical protein